MWQKLIFDYSQSIKKYSLTLNELYGSPICQNKTINRRLTEKSIREIAEWLVSNKCADWTNQEAKDTIFVYWKSPSDVAQAVFGWAKNTGRIGSIETVLDIIEDEF
jgi:hypothetical protein